MKWARVKGQSAGTSFKQKDSDQDRKNDAFCFDDYPDAKTLAKNLEQDKNEWARHSFKYHFPEPVAENYLKFQNRYENFIGGFLTFYDNVVRSRATDHTIHFNWSQEKGKGSGDYTVRIFISPAPQKPIKGYAKQAGKSVEENNTGKNSKALQYMTTAGLGDGEDLSVDPPPPPPPPPPTMH